jgi:hypothetical protein
LSDIVGVESWEFLEWSKRRRLKMEIKLWQMLMGYENVDEGVIYPSLVKVGWRGVNLNLGSVRSTRKLAGVEGS